MVQSQDRAQLLMLVNIGIVLLLVGSLSAIAIVLVRRSVRQRVKAERLAAMGTATARILHQIKNPLQGILLQAELLRSKGTVDESARSDVSRAITGEGARVTELLAELSAYASGTRRKLRPEPLELDLLVGAIVDVERPLGAQEGIAVATGTVEAVEIAGDMYFLRQALENLVRNAREALREVSRDRVRRVDVDVRRQGGSAIVEVRDTGPGIEAERLAMVFEPFTSSKSKGMGLGLPISREIIEGHGGRIELRSIVGRGTTVRAIFPVLAGMVRRAQSEDEAERVRARLGDQ